MIDKDYDYMIISSQIVRPGSVLVCKVEYVQSDECWFYDDTAYSDGVEKAFLVLSFGADQQSLYATIHTDKGLLKAMARSEAPITIISAKEGKRAS